MSLKVSNIIRKLIFTGSLFWAVSAQAQQDSLFLSVEQLFESGIKSSLQLQSDSLKERMAHERKLYAKTGLLPDLEIGLKGGIIGQPVVFQNGLSNPTYPDTPDWSQNYVVDFSQPIYRGGKLRHAIRRAGMERSLAALQSDPKIWSDAYERKVIVSSPTNLFALLKLVADLWKYNDQDKNTKEIAACGLKLYEQLVAFTASLEGVGAALGKAREAYEDAHKRLCTGNDNIIRVGERLRRTARLQTKRQHAPRTLELAGSDTVEEAPAEIPEETPAPDGSGSRADVPTGTSESGTPTD